MAFGARQWTPPKSRWVLRYGIWLYIRSTEEYLRSYGVHPDLNVVRDNSCTGFAAMEEGIVLGRGGLTTDQGT